MPDQSPFLSRQTKALALTLALTSCGQQSEEQAPTLPKAPPAQETPVEKTDTATKLEEDTQVVTVPAPEELTPPPQITPEQIIYDTLRQWNARTEDGNWKLSIKERDIAINALKSVLGIPDEYDVGIKSPGGTDNGALPDGTITATALHLDFEGRWDIPFTANLKLGKTTFIDKEYPTGEFAKTFQEVASKLERLYRSLETDDALSKVFYASPQRATNTELFIPLFSFTGGGRNYPALVLQATFDLKTEELDVPTRGLPLETFIDSVRPVLSALQLWQGEVFVIRDEGKGSRIKIENDWSSITDELPDYRLSMDFFLSDSIANVTNAQLPPMEFAELLTHVASCIDPERHSEFTFGFASKEIAVLQLTVNPDSIDPETDDKFPYELYVFQKPDNAQYGWRTTRLVAEETSPTSEGVTFEQRGYRVTYQPAYSALYVADEGSKERYTAPLMKGQRETR